MGTAELMARKTLPEPTLAKAEVTDSVSPRMGKLEEWIRANGLTEEQAIAQLQGLQWCKRQGTRAIWQDDARTLKNQCRIKVDGDIEYQSGSFEETIAQCEERLQRRRMRMARR